MSCLCTLQNPYTVVFFFPQRAQLKYDFYHVTYATTAKDTTFQYCFDMVGSMKQVS